ncbi:ATP-dependent nuclease [Flavobacterium humi]|uniref:ATP-binding protein n=1 Tax=Flavobacterium humi TaxID=2562683 RepID=A0A4Z0L8D4_9FLAO|nr:AAA family ATPase [Flavobacterium humi]TGD58252.1 ATP-binding protein [Flavobacterium humi]
MPSIIIENLKNIRLLNFEIPNGGVHVLTSVNGSGKTTLLTCLERIINSYAFQRHFKTSNNDQFDNYRNARITYIRNATTSVTYRYKNTRWVPAPRKNSNLLLHLGFSQVIYLTSSDERFYIQNQELNTANISAASQFIKDGMNEIFQTTKFTDLRRIKLIGKGLGNVRRNFGYVLPLGTVGGQNRYFSEKNFSLGEVLILNALSELSNAVNNGLVLIDEIELALHPKVQILFLNFLKRIANNKNLTVILSTHSSSLIKAAPRLIFLSRNSNGNVEVEYDCYPAIALQNVAITEEVQPDIVFFVEDISAKYLLQELINYYLTHINTTRRPIMKILPVAGYKQTVYFMVSSMSYLIPSNTKVYSFLDQDVQLTINTLAVKVNRTISEQELLNVFNANNQIIKYLPITPELGIVTHLNNNPTTHIIPLQNLFNEVFDISQIIVDENNRGLVYSANPRDAAKVRIQYYIERIKNATNLDEPRIKIMLTQYYSIYYGINNVGLLQGLLNPIFV